MRQVRLFKPSVGEAELEAVRGVFERAWMGLGPKVGEFEAAFSAYLGTPQSVAVNSGTAALHLALGVFGFPAGKKVLVPSLTFVASATAAMYNHLEPVFVDVDPETLGLDFDDLERKIDADTVAVVAVHFGGYPVAMDRLMDLAQARGLKVIEDCAHSAGGAYLGRKLGTWGDIGCFSFEEKKCMTTGDGGMISSHDADLLKPLRPRRWVGIDKDTWQRAGHYTTGDLDVRHWYYEVADLGYKYNMNDLAAAIGLVQLGRLDGFNARRRAIVGRYLAGLKNPALRPLLPFRSDGEDAWHLFGVRSDHRDALIRHLKPQGVATGVHYMPLTLHPLFRAHKGSTPVAEHVWHDLLTLPLFPDMTDDDVDYVVDLLNSFG